MAVYTSLNSDTSSVYFIDEERNPQPPNARAPQTILILSASVLPALLELSPGFCGVHLMRFPPVSLTTASISFAQLLLLALVVFLLQSLDIKPSLLY